jgi:ParB family chromosome partitioning protein
VRDAITPREQLELALVENLQRSDLDPIESARGYERLSREFGMTQDEIATRVGKDRATVANALRLLKLPESVLACVRDGRLSAGHARALVPLAESPDELRSTVAKVLAQQLNVRAAERIVAQLTARPKAVRTAERERRGRTFEYATKVLSEALHTAVQLKPRADGSGQIVIEYHDAEELERLISSLRQVQ